MPKEMMQEFMGKVCSISLFNDSFGMVGKIVAVEDNWIKVENKKEVRILNGDMVQSITLMPEKYQNKDQKGEINMSKGMILLLLIALYFVIKWAVKNGIRDYYEEQK